MAFATAADVAARLGRDEYTGNDLAQVNALLDAVYDDLLAAVDKTEAWAEDASTTIPATLKNISVEAVVRVLLNPTGARSTSETLGAHSYAQSFADGMGMGAVTLTDAEERRARRAVWGTTTASARTGGIIDDVLDDGLLGGRYSIYAGTEDDA